MSGSPRNGLGPRPFKQHRASTTFLRVPSEDWPLVKSGKKTEYRSGVGQNVTQLWSIKTPTPVVAYRKSRAGYDHAMMVLESTWREPLGAITEESLGREGFDSVGEFRRYFMKRERRHFTPTREVQVYRVRPWLAGDAQELADLIFSRLYGDFLEPGFTSNER